MNSQSTEAMSIYEYMYLIIDGLRDLNVHFFGYPIISYLS